MGCSWTRGSAWGLPSARCVLCSDALIKREVSVTLRETSLGNRSSKYLFA